MQFDLTYNKTSGKVTISNKTEDFSVWNEVDSDTASKVKIRIEVDIDPEDDLPEE